MLAQRSKLLSAAGLLATTLSLSALTVLTKSTATAGGLVPQARVSHPTAKPTSQDRHIYNHSRTKWTLKVVHEDGHNAGDVHFTSSGCEDLGHATAASSGTETRHITSHGPAVINHGAGTAHPQSKMQINDNRFDCEGTERNGPFGIGGKCTLAIQYTTTKGHCTGYWELTDAHGQAKRFSFSDVVVDGNIKIHPGGNTGPIQFNEPADGDITISGDSW